MCWSVYRTLIGYLGGTLFEDNELLAIAIGIGLALLVSGVIELVRRARTQAGSPC